MSNTTSADTGTDRREDTFHARRWLILAVASVGQLIIALDSTVVSVMGPQLQHDLDLSATGLQWVFNNYIVLFGGLLLLGGRLNDVIGRRRMFFIGLALFGIGSLIAARASVADQLLVARAIQGIGAAALSPACLSLLVVAFRSPLERAKAFGVWGAVIGTGAGLGTMLGGAIVQVDWRLAFYINLPIAVGLAVAAFALVPKDHRAGPAPRVDIPGALTGTLGLISLVFSIVSVHTDGWTGIKTLGTFFAAVLLLVLFVLIEHRAAEPLLPLGLLGRRTVLAGSLGEFFTAGLMMPMFMLLPIYMQTILGYSPIKTGVAYIPTTLAMMIFAGPLSKGIAKIGARGPYLLGVAFLTGLLVLTIRTPLSGSYWAIMLPITALLGLGLVMCLIPTPTVGTASATAKDAGTISSILIVATQLGGALGLAISATIMQSHLDDQVRAGVPVHTALNEALHYAMYPFFGWMALSLLNGLFGFRGIRITEDDLVPAEARA
ncbi:MFS transporter [Nocardia tengchongensis]|uniref:MFS transporter n=1 Tax=Nocardia tengchongensis TaxID=2055889 RepID=UPI00368A6AF8